MRREEARERKRGWNRVILSRKRSGQVVVGGETTGEGGEREEERWEKRNMKRRLAHRVNSRA